jgi:adenylate cyclase
MRRELRDGLLLGLGAVLLTLLLSAAGSLSALEASTWRWRVAHFARGPVAAEPIVLIAVDQASLDWGRQENELSWPWPRAAYTLVVDYCRRAGVRSLSFDLLFTEPSVYGVDDDQAFADALLKLPASVGSVALGSGGSLPGELTASTLPTGLGTGHQATATLPVPALRSAFGRLGDVSGRPDADGLFRHATLLSRFGTTPVAALPLAAYLAARPQVTVAAADGGLRIADRFIPVDAKGRSLLRYRGPSGTFPTFSAAAVIQSELQLQSGETPTLDPGRLQGAHVFFGLTAPGLFDLRPTPLDGVFPGMEIHATALDNLLVGDFMRPVTPVLSWAFATVLAMGAGFVMRRCHTLTPTLIACLLLLPLAPLAGFIAYAQGYWLPVALPGVATGLALIGGVGYNFATEGRKKREIRRAFNQYLHPSVIEQLVADPAMLRLGGEKRELSIFFSDLAGFSTISEQLEPEPLTALLNAYLTEMTDIILDAGGTIDKYEGDAIIAFWNAPLSQPDHALRAVKAAIDCQQRLAELRPLFKERFGHELWMRIGLNTGAAVVGNMGSTRRFDYTMLGDAVNLAARLEGVNKVFGTEILFSEATRQQMGDTVPVREVATVRVVGRHEPVPLFTPLATAPPAGAGFVVALEAYRLGDFATASSAFEAMASTDPVAASYARRCRQLLSQPPSGWEGVWDLQDK